jgi:3-oxoadipate enol-lactonase
MAFGLFNHQVLHFRDENPQQPRAIVLANSLGTDFRIWDEMIARLGGAWRIVRYDLRGHGLSDAPAAPYFIDDHVADLIALIEARKVERALIVGLSVGGMVALGLAARRRDLAQALVLCDTAHRIGSAEMWNARIEAVRKGGIASIADAILERWFSAGFRTTRAGDLAGYRNMLTRTPLEGYIGTCAAVRDADLTTEARGLTQPTLCLVGEEDGATPPELVRSLSALVSKAKFEIVPNAAHLPCIEQPEILAARIAAFAKETLIA